MTEIVSPTTYFRFLHVDMGDPLWVDVQRLRYLVYCEELKFLDPAAYPTGLESDEFDPVSVQFAAVNHDKHTVATLRLVADSKLGFPLEHHSASLWPAFSELPRDKTVEISRLILSKQYRRRANDDRYGTGGTGPAPSTPPGAPAQRRSPYPLILFGLFRLMFERSVSTGIEWWLCAMEPWLRTYLSRFGFTFTAVGDPIEYYGEVVPYAAKVEEIFRTVSTMKPEILQMVLGGGGAESS